MLVQVIYTKNFNIKIIIFEFNEFKNMYEQYGGTIHLFEYDHLSVTITDIKKKYGLNEKHFKYYNFDKPQQLKRSSNVY